MTGDKPFCNAMYPTNMRMSGLSWHMTSDDACLVWLFEDAVMDSKGKLVLGLFGSFALGFIQGVLLKAADGLRKKYKRERGIMDIIVYTLCYFVLLVNGYLLMILAMAGWIPMLLVTVLGIVTGHIAKFYKKENTLEIETRLTVCSGDSMEQTQPCGC